MLATATGLRRMSCRRDFCFSATFVCGGSRIEFSSKVCCRLLTKLLLYLTLAWEEILSALGIRKDGFTVISEIVFLTWLF